MPCCGQKRAAASIAQPITEYKLPARSETPAASPAREAVVPLRYLENSRIVVRGPATGRNYDFSANEPVQPVAAADARSLLRSGLFREDR